MWVDIAILTKMRKKTKILIIDDQPVVLTSLKYLIEEQGLGHIVATVSTGKELLEVIEKAEPDMVLADIETSINGTVEALKTALSKNPQIRILIMNKFLDTLRKNLKSNNFNHCLHTDTLNKKEFEKAIKRS